MKRQASAGIALVLLLAPSGAHAGACSVGDLHAMFQALEVFVGVQGPRGIDSRMLEQIHGPLGGPCQYRLWAGTPLDSEEEPPVQEFVAGQPFLGGSLYFWDYAYYRMPRRAAIADIELLEEHVYLVPAGDDWSWSIDDLEDYEVAYDTTAYRDSVHYEYGRIVSRQIGFIERLPAGRYVSVLTSSYPGNPDLADAFPELADWFLPYEYSSVVHLDILPAAP